MKLLVVLDAGLREAHSAAAGRPKGAAAAAHVDSAAKRLKVDRLAALLVQKGQALPEEKTQRTALNGPIKER